MMVDLFLSKPNWKQEENREIDSNFGKQWILLLNKLGSIIWSVIANSVGGKSEARLWLCNSIANINSLTPRQHKDLFLKLLRKRPSNKSLPTQALHMLFEKRRKEVGNLIAKRSHLLEKFFDGKPERIMQWFSNFAENGGSDHKKGAKALSQFAFVNRDICWEELEWKGKHGQSPAVVATKPHYFLDLDVRRTVENFIDNVPEFWSSSAFAETLQDGDIVFTDTKYFVELFLRLMYEEDANDIWDVISEFLMEESFSYLCKHLLINLEEEKLCTFLETLGRLLSLQTDIKNFGNSSFWLGLVLSEFKDRESIDQLILLNVVVSYGRQLLRLLQDEELDKQKSDIKDIVSQILTISSTANGLACLLNECFKLKSAKAVKFLGLQSWVVHYILLEETRSLESWESLFSSNGISFRKSDKYALVDHVFSDENDSELDDVSLKRKRKKKRKSRKKRRSHCDDDDFYENEWLGFERSNDQLGFQSTAGSWLLSTDGYSASWTLVDIPEHLSKFCFSTWMKWLLNDAT